MVGCFHFYKGFNGILALLFNVGSMEVKQRDKNPVQMEYIQHHKKTEDMECIYVYLQKYKNCSCTEPPGIMKKYGMHCMKNWYAVQVKKFVKNQVKEI